MHPEPRNPDQGHAGQAPFGAGETPLDRHTRAGEPELLRARATVEGQLSERGIDVHDNDTDDAVADLLAAVESFEAAVRERGGDSLTNTPESSRPDRAAFVIPSRGADESAVAFIGRLERASLRASAEPPDSGDAISSRFAERVTDHGEVF